MAQTKRNAGLTSAVPRATLNDEELVSVFIFFFILYLHGKNHFPGNNSV